MELKLYNHGLSSIGVIGHKGAEGERGKSIFFGDILSFFNTTTVTVDDSIKIANMTSLRVFKQIEIIKQSLLYAYRAMTNKNDDDETILTNMYIKAILSNIEITNQTYTGFFTNETIKEKLNGELHNMEIIDMDINNNYINNLILLLLSKGLKITEETIREIFDETSTKVEVTYRFKPLSSANNNYEWETTDGDGGGELPKSNGLVISSNNLIYNIENVKDDVFNMDIFAEVYDDNKYVDTNNTYMLFKYNSETEKYVITQQTNQIASDNKIDFYCKRALKLKPLSNLNNENDYFKIEKDIFLAKTTSASNFEPNEISLYGDSQENQRYLDEYNGFRVPSTLDNMISLNFTYDPNAADNKIPTTLKDEIKVGDIIYYYTTDTDSLNTTITNMFVVSEQFVGCEYTVFLENSTLINPFDMTYLNLENNRVYSANKLITLFSNEETEENALTKYSYRTICNNISKYNDTNFIVMYVLDDNNEKPTYIRLTAEKPETNQQNINTRSIDTSTCSMDLATIYVPKDDIESEDNVSLFNQKERHIFGELYLPYILSNTLKFDNMSVRNNTYMSNVEAHDAIYDSNIILDNYNVKSILDIYEVIRNGKKYIGYTMYAKDYFENIRMLGDYTYGYEIYDEFNVLFMSDMTSDISKNFVILLDLNDKKYISELQIKFYIIAFAANKKGIKFYSKMTELTELIYNNNLRDWSINVLGLNNSSNKNINENSNNITFSSSGIRCESSKDNKLNIYTQDSNIHIKDIYINLTVLTDQGMQYSNNWLTITNTSSSLETSLETYEFTFDVGNNISPVEYGKPAPATIDEYMTSLCDKDDYVSEDCSLFSKLNNSEDFMSTKSRSVVVTVSYTIGENNILYNESYNIIQPGFTDYRDIPLIDITMYNSIEDIQKLNTVENNVLCNQFSTYMDVDISNLEKNWLTYSIEDKNNVEFDFEITNIKSDIGWHLKYLITPQVGSSSIVRSTIKIVNDENYILPGDLNNYVSLNISLDKEYGRSQQSNIDISNNISVEIVHADDYTNSIIDNKILFTEEVTKTLINPKSISKGITENITISFKDITPEMLNDQSKFRFRIDFEMGNPVIASLYLRFAVTKVQIRYIDANGKSTKFTAVTNETKYGIDTYLYDYTTTNRLERYKFISEPLDVIINPLSYIVCDSAFENDITNIQGSVKKTGSDAQIAKTLKFYATELYDTTNGIITYGKTADDIIHRRLFYSWNGLLLKKMYLQDNIKNITVDPIDPLQFKGTSLAKLLEPIFGSTSAIDVIKGNRYISLIYNSVIMNPKYRDGKYTFFYNDKEYDKNRYNQLENQYPVFISDNAVMNIRSTELLSAMDTWNFEYTNSSKFMTDVTFKGVLNMYGNGYACLQPNIDLQLYGSDFMSLQEVKNKNNEYFFNSVYHESLYYKTTSKIEPMQNGLFRTFLYDINWEYPKYSSDGKVYGYQIVSAFDYFLNTLPNDKIADMPKSYKEKLNKLKEKNERMIPYNVLFDIYPRVAYNTENKTLNIFMLRRPSIGQDNDREHDFEECYNLSTRYFDLTDGLEIQTIENGYMIKT